MSWTDGIFIKITGFYGYVRIGHQLVFHIIIVLQLTPVRFESREIERESERERPQ